MSNPALAETNPDGDRWYVHPTTGERFISVTTVLNSISKFGLVDWAAGLTAQAAFDRLDWLNRAAAVDTCNARGDDACGNCRACVVTWLTNRHAEARDAAGDIGTKLHDAGEEHALFGPGATVDADVAPFFDGYLRWVEQWQPAFEATEMTVISRKWGYAGTLDWIARFALANLPKQFRHLADLPVVGDTKSSKSVDLTKGWQVVAYAKADAVLLPDGTELPMPEVNGGLILHIRPGKVQVREVYLTAAAHDNFVRMLNVVEGLSAGLNTVLSRPYTLEPVS